MRPFTRLLQHYPRTTTGLVITSVCLTASVAVVMAYQPEIGRLKQQAEEHRRELAREVENQLALRFTVVGQQSRNLAALAEPLDTPRLRAEPLLLQLLNASPAHQVYGMGIWYRAGEVPGFPGGLFGPYARYGEDGRPGLTRQWMTPEYNYPGQPWFRQIAEGRGSLRCTPPYWDQEQVFLTCGQSFPPDTDRPRGVVSVDMVLPQLDRMLAGLGSPGQEILYLTHGDRLLAHPDADALLKEARARGMKADTVLDLPAGYPRGRLQPVGGWREFHRRLDYGWELHIVSRGAWLEAGLHNLYLRMGLWLVLILLAGAIIDAVWLYSTRHMRTALSRNLSLRNALSDAVPSGVFLCDEHRRIVWSNPAFERLAGQTGLDRLLEDLIEAEDRNEVQELWTEAAGQSEPASGEFRLGDDSECWVLMRLVRVPSDDTHGEGMAGTLDDITERRNTEEALRLAKEEAELASRSKSDFLATMSHEIRTPMNGVIGMANLLQESPLNSEQDGYVRTLQSSAGTLLKILNDILDLSRIEAGKFPIEQHPFRLRELVDEILALLKPLADQKDIDLDCGLPPDLPEVVIGDADRVKQVLLNLLGNAIKFTDAGSVTLSITRSRAREDCACLSFHVVDSGIGLSLEQQSRIFSPFTQADSSTTRRYGGTGLGLAICRRLVSLMGGEIHCYSEPGQGAHFWFDLDFPLPGTGGDSAAATARFLPRALRANARILVVEDNPVNLQVVQAMLKKLGLTPESAANGEEALQRLEADTGYDLVLMDCQMPVLDGFDATRRWREREAETGRPRLPIVALTANAMRGDAERCLAVGMDAYLSKPLTISALTAELGRWLAA